MKINRNKNVFVPHPGAKRLISRHKKTGLSVRFFEIGYLSGGKFYWVGDRCLAALQFGQCFAYHLLGKAGTFTTLAGNAGGLAHVTVAAATFKDCIADLPVGDACAEAYIHK
jgi:hypothetical protein